MGNRIKMALFRLMQGRNGPDMLGVHALWAGLILALANLFVGSMLLYVLSNALYFYSFFRMFSRNVVKRRTENLRYAQFAARWMKEVRQFLLRVKGSREYKYFRCPGCKNRLRLRRGCGEKHITCPVCKHQFDQKA